MQVNFQAMEFLYELTINQFSQNNITVGLTRCLAEVGEIAFYL